MKVAVLISGEYRTFRYCRPTMSFLNDPRVDVYISTWDSTRYISPKINLDITEFITNDQIIADLGFLPKKIILDCSRSLVEYKYNSKMINRWITGWKTIKDSDVQYDYVIVTRPDLFFKNKINLDNIAFSDEGLAVTWPHRTMFPADYQEHLHDILLTSSFSIVDNIFDDRMLNMWVESNENKWHKWWYDYCYSKIKNIISTGPFLRCTFYRYLTPPYVDEFEDVLKYHIDWRDLRLLNDWENTGVKSVSEHWALDTLIEAKRKWESGYFDRYKN